MLEAVTLEAARRWFLSHSQGSILCQRKSPDNPRLTEKQECASYPEAEAWYADEPQQNRGGLSLEDGPTGDRKVDKDITDETRKGGDA